MRVIVIMRYPSFESTIREGVAKINPERVSDIVFADPSGLEEMVRANEPTLVITCQRFGTKRDGEGKEVERPTGCDLAGTIKGINPGAICLVFGRDPPVGDRRVDGFVPPLEQGGLDVIARLLASDLSGATPASIRARFQEIQ